MKLTFFLPQRRETQTPHTRRLALTSTCLFYTLSCTEIWWLLLSLLNGHWIYLGRVCNDVVVCRVWRWIVPELYVRLRKRTLWVVTARMRFYVWVVTQRRRETRFGFFTWKKLFMESKLLANYTDYYLPIMSKIFKMLNVWISKWMVQSQSTLTGRTVTFSAHTTLLKPQGNASFSRTPVNYSSTDTEAIGGPGLYYTIRDLWHALWNISWNVYNWGTDSMYGTLHQSFNQISKVMDQHLLHTCSAIRVFGDLRIIQERPPRHTWQTTTSLPLFPSWSRTDHFHMTRYRGMYFVNQPDTNYRLLNWLPTLP